MLFKLLAGIAAIRLKPSLDIHLIRPINGTAMKIKASLPLVSTNGKKAAIRMALAKMGLRPFNFLIPL